MWQTLDFPLLEETYPQTKIYLDALTVGFAEDDSYLHQTFMIPDHQLLLKYLHFGKAHESAFFSRFWLTPSVTSVFPHGFREYDLNAPNVFRMESPYLLSGHLAMAQALGGMYGSGKPEDGGVQASMMGRAVADELIHNDYNNCRYFASDVDWCNFFDNAARDYTWIVFDLARMIVHVILVTDHD